MTRRGIGLIAAAVILFLLADLTRTGWIQFADSLLWAIIVLGVALPLLALPALDFSVVLEPPVKREGMREGDAAAVSLRIRNRRPWPRFGLRVTAELQSAGRPPKPIAFYVPFVAPGADLTLRGSVVMSERGLYRLQQAKVESSAPVGVLRRRKRILAEAQLLVLPAAYAVFSAETSRPAEGTVPKNRPAQTGDDTAGSRPYVPGDPSRALHWRNYARTGRLMTKAYTISAGDTPVLIIAPPGTVEAFDGVARLAAGAVERWTRHGERVRLQNGAVELQQSRDEMLRALALASWENVALVDESLRWLGPNAAATVVVSGGDAASLRQIAAAAPRLAARLTALVLGALSTQENEEARSLLARLGVAVVVYEPLQRAATDVIGQGERRAA